MAEISITNLKNINKLQFEIPNGGVHVLTGVNGSGKTTLLACLERLTNRNAFPKYFRTSHSSNLDVFNNARITYHAKSQEVTYSYANTRWVPRPKRNASLLMKLGYAEAIHLPSSPERFYTQDKSLESYPLPAPSFIKDGMNEIFSSNKFNSLKRIKLSGKGLGEGRSNYGYVMPVINSSLDNYYYTEKNFSLGEVLILNALHILFKIKKKALVLIDELELALHPQVQVNFLNFLEEYAKAKDLTIILSTHSSSLIRAAKKVIYLERDMSGEVKINYHAYPAVVLKELSFSEEYIPDIVFCVEDENAKFFLTAAICAFQQTKSTSRATPEVKILPVGGWPTVIELRQQIQGGLFHQRVRIKALPDLDAKSSIEELNRKMNKSEVEKKLIQKVKEAGSNLIFLPITPEVGLYEYFTQEAGNLDSAIQKEFGAGNIHLSRIIREEKVKFGNNRSDKIRDLAKSWLRYIVQEIKAVSNEPENYIVRLLFRVYVNEKYSKNPAELSKFIGPVLG